MFLVASRRMSSVVTSGSIRATFDGSSNALSRGTDQRIHRNLGLRSDVNNS
jgi:hypothetical protein